MANDLFDKPAAEATLYDEKTAIGETFKPPAPTVGRIVLYTPMPDDAPQPRAGKAFAAIVTDVFPGDICHLTVFVPGQDGRTVEVRSVQRGEQIGQSNRWFWPPRV